MHLDFFRGSFMLVSTTQISIVKIIRLCWATDSTVKILYIGWIPRKKRLVDDTIYIHLYSSHSFASLLLFFLFLYFLNSIPKSHVIMYIYSIGKGLLEGSHTWHSVICGQNEELSYLRKHWGVYIMDRLLFPNPNPVYLSTSECNFVGIQDFKGIW